MPNRRTRSIVVRLWINFVDLIQIMSSAYYYKNLFIALLTLFCVNILGAQTRFTISGTIRDRLTGETMIGVSVKALDSRLVNQTTCNEYGFYSLPIPF